VNGWIQARLLAVMLMALAAPGLAWAATSTTSCAGGDKTATAKAQAGCAAKGQAKPKAAAKAKATSTTKAGKAGKAGKGANAKANTRTASKAATAQGKKSRSSGAAGIRYQTPASEASDAAQAAEGTQPLAAAAPALRPLLHPPSPCFHALASSNAARHLAGKVPYLVDAEANAAQLAQSARPSKMERSELSSVLAGYEMCLDMSADWRQASYTPEAQNLLDAYWAQTKSVLGALAGGKLSYGEAARAVAENDSSYKRQIDALAQP